MLSCNLSLYFHFSPYSTKIKILKKTAWYNDITGCADITIRNAHGWELWKFHNRGSRYFWMAFMLDSFTWEQGALYRWNDMCKLWQKRPFVPMGFFRSGRKPPTHLSPRSGGKIDGLKSRVKKTSRGTEMCVSELNWAAPERCDFIDLNDCIQKLPPLLGNWMKYSYYRDTLCPDFLCPDFLCSCMHRHACIHQCLSVCVCLYYVYVDVYADVYV